MSSIHATGQYHRTSVAGEQVRAFVPNPLPRKTVVDLSGSTGFLLGQAAEAVARLDGVASVLPDPLIFLYSFVRKEAQLSSQIEGTQSSLSELLAYESAEAPGVPMDDVLEVANYVAALEHGVARIRGGFPLSNRLLREIHSILLRSGRGAASLPGEFRRSQNWIGGTRPGNAHFVPAPIQEVMPCMGDLELFLHQTKGELPPLVVAAMAHVQFETIHPFLDGNGRVGRLLITLLLTERGVLREPLLYLSLWLKSHRDVYYQKLDGVRIDGNWQGWFEFFLEGVRESAASAVQTAQRLLKLFDQDQAKLQASGRIAGNVLRVHGELKRKVIVSVPGLSSELSLAAPTVNRALQKLVLHGIAREISGRKRGRQWAYSDYLQILSEGTEPYSN
ncbi:MAG: Fic family protein [Planctomycetes bacterium]|nr:Fic family protein [Planctomycetota bacterium]